MSSIYDNKKALQYALNSIPEMQELSMPLQKHLGICSFSYMRIYDDCRYLSLLNGYEEFTKTFFETIKTSDPHFIETMRSIVHGEPQFTLWPTSRENMPPIFSLLDAHNIWHGFQISYRRDRYCELFSFTFDKSSDDKTTFFLKNIPLLLKFTDFFRNQAGDLIDDRDKSKIAMFSEKFDIKAVNHEDNLQNFLNDLEKPYLLQDLSGNQISLTKRESECLKILTTNKTAKEIANILNLSHRTVELHISNIKNKLGINYKSQLLKVLSNTT
jgi:DNA-binding CsgD family transcriptional regulator